MRKKDWLNAVVSSILYFILTMFITGVKLRLNKTQLIIPTNDSIRCKYLFLGVVVVFIVQLFQPSLLNTWKNLQKKYWIKLTFNQSTVKIKTLSIFMILFAIIFPFMASQNSIDITILTLIYIMLGLGLNVVVGLSGLLVLGYAGFYAIGAYTFALLNRYFEFSFWESLPIAGLTSGLSGFFVGLLVLRLRGDYLAIVTLGFSEILRILVLNNTNLTGGSNGISQLPKPTFFGLEFSRTAKKGWNTFHHFFGINYNPEYKSIFFYFVALLLVVLILFIINRLLHMPLGRSWEALREDETACRALGMSTTRIKLSAFIISSSIAGFAGILFASRQGFISPESFTFSESVFVLAIVVLGGMGSQVSVILAASVLVVSREIMRDLNPYNMLFLGALMIFIMILRPQGLLPIQSRQIKLKNALSNQDDKMKFSK